MVVKRATRSTLTRAVGLSAAVLAAVLIGAPLIGSTTIDLAQAFTARESTDSVIFFSARLPRVLLAMLAGGALAVAGVLFQALLRDALATPYTLGVSSGASLGAVIAICFGLELVAHLPAIWVAAFLGSAIALATVLAVASEGRRMSSFTLLLSGVTMNSVCLAVILFLQNVASFTQSVAITRWLMGSIEAVEYSTLFWLSVAVFPPLAFIFWKAGEWNLLSVGEEWAASRGVNVTQLMRGGFLAGSLLTGAVTALTGPIGFVGLIVPHALRMRLGADHRLLIPCSFLLGAAFLALCDTLSRVILAPTEVPVGVITALLGGPFFIWLLRSRRRSLWL
ncbi:MAG: iron ABC transporter permease [Bryobacteraceae bacterium]|nr:iron ABC transporter permease [Bryobacteraceae bacterium]